MNNNKLSSLQIGALTFFLSKSTFTAVILYGVLQKTHEDAIIAVVLGSLLSFIPIFIYLYIANYKKDLSIDEKIKKLFGNKIGIIINIIFVLTVFLLTVISIWDLVNYIMAQYLSETSRLFITLVFIIPIAYALTKNIESFGRVSWILFIVFVILTIIIMLGLGNKLNFENFLPLFKQKPINIISAAFLYLAHTSAHVFLILSIPKNRVSDNQKYGKKMLLFNFFNCALSFIITFYIIGVIGYELASVYQYPAYATLKKISILGFIERIENILSIQWIFDYFVICVLSLYFVGNTIKHQFKLNSKKTSNIIIVVLSSLAVIGSQYIFQNGTKARNWLIEKYSILNIITFILLPLLLCIFIFFKKRKIKKPT